jgi:hypothetical protein
MKEMAPAPVRRWLAAAFDYAGLFPPASLSLETTVRRYARYRQSADAWALGRLVVPAAQVAEVARAVPASSSDGPWPLAVLVRADVEADRSRALAAAAHGDRVWIAALEAKVAVAAEVEPVARRLRSGAPPEVELYVEAPLSNSIDATLDAIRASPLRAKVRTGGITAEAIPSAASLVDFLHGCVARGLPFKVTAGLHHASRGTYPLTYDRDSPRAQMHGFLNVFATTAFLVAGLPPASAAGALEETDTRAFRFDGEALTWRQHRAPGEAVARSRTLLVSCGTCSFDEPIEDLRASGLWAS